MGSTAYAIHGGSGTDHLTYVTGPIPSVSIHLPVAGPQNTGGGGVESILAVEDISATVGPT